MNRCLTRDILLKNSTKQVPKNLQATGCRLLAMPCGSLALEELPILQRFGDGSLMLQELDAGESLGLKEYEAEEAVLPQQEPVR